MNNSRKLSLLSLFWILFCFGGLGYAFYYFSSQSIFMILDQISPLNDYQASPEIKLFLTQLRQTLISAKEYLLPVVSGMFGITAILLWIFIRISITSILKSENKPPDTPVKVEEPKIQGPTKKEMQMADKVRALHLLSLLQREGRLLDFLSEDLEVYEDEQIGAAVRDIHEKCKKVLQKHINPKPVLDQGEGDEVTVSAGFDPSSIKLTGSVSGEPPFKGLLRHKGWRASQFDMPTLAAKKDPDIIAPAEVEIL